MEKCIRDLQSQLIEKYGVGQKNRIQRGVCQVAQIWRPEDGTLDDFKSFIINYFVGDEELKEKLFKKFEKQIENLDGYNLLVELGLREPIDLNLGSIDEVDKIFAAYNPVAHLLDDFFKNKLAHIVLLNFPVTNLAERLNEGEKWTRREWAETRLSSRFSKRISADIIQKMSEAFLAAEAYISEYKFCMDHVVTGNGERHFQKGLKLISHWDLRDEIRGLYSDKTDNPAHVFFKQRMIQGIMEKIVYQDVPLAIINNPHLDIDGIKSNLSIEDLIFVSCRGGWPESLNKKSKESQLLLPSIYVDTICESDASKVDGTRRSPNRVKNILRSYARNISTIATDSTIIKDIKTNYEDISPVTYYSYIDALERLFVIDNLNAWSPNIRSKTAIRSTSKKEFIDPSIAVASLNLTPEILMEDLNTFGFIFENLCIRDLKVYSSSVGGDISYYRDRYGLEADCVLHLNDGRYCLIEFKLGSSEEEKGAQNLLKLKELIEKNNMKPPSFLAIITGGEIAYTRKDGVKVIPIGCLR